MATLLLERKVIFDPHLLSMKKIATKVIKDPTAENKRLFISWLDVCSVADMLKNTKRKTIIANSREIETIPNILLFINES